MNADVRKVIDTFLPKSDVVITGMKCLTVVAVVAIIANAFKK